MKYEIALMSLISAVAFLLGYFFAVGSEKACPSAEGKLAYSAKDGGQVVCTYITHTKGLAKKELRL